MGWWLDGALGWLADVDLAPQPLTAVTAMAAKRNAKSAAKSQAKRAAKAKSKGGPKASAKGAAKGEGTALDQATGIRFSNVFNSMFTFVSVPGRLLRGSQLYAYILWRLLGGSWGRSCEAGSWEVAWRLCAGYWEVLGWFFGDIGECIARLLGGSCEGLHPAHSVCGRPSGSYWEALGRRLGGSCRLRYRPSPPHISNI